MDKSPSAQTKSFKQEGTMLKRFNYHFKISMLKSVVRIMGIVLGMTTKNLELLCSLFLVAELLGIFEEFENDEN